MWKWIDLILPSIDSACKSRGQLSKDLNKVPLLLQNLGPNTVDSLDSFKVKATLIVDGWPFIPNNPVTNTA